MKYDAVEIGIEQDPAAGCRCRCDCQQYGDDPRRLFLLHEKKQDRQHSLNAEEDADDRDRNRKQIEIGREEPTGQKREQNDCNQWKVLHKSAFLFQMIFCSYDYTENFRLCQYRQHRDEPTIIKRQQYLLKVFIDEWDLKCISQGTVDLTNDGAIIYHVTLRGPNATGYANSDHFTVYSGSKIAADTVPSFAQYYQNAFDLRNQLIDSGVIENNQFTVDYCFDSLSLAASVVIGRTANAYREWKDSTGLSYSENQ